MAKRNNKELPISDVIQEIIQANKLQYGLDEVAVQEAWTSIMGNGVGHYTQNVTLKGKQLIVSLTSAVLREELSHNSSKIIEMMNEYLRRDVIATVILR